MISVVNSVIIFWPVGPLLEPNPSVKYVSRLCSWKCGEEAAPSLNFGHP